MTIETSYRGHAIRYNDNTDEWYCPDLAGFSYSKPKLSLVREAIDKMHRDLRKKVGFECFEFNGSASHNKPTLTPTKIVEYLKPITEGGGYTGKPVATVDHKVACVAQREGSSKPSRMEVELKRLVPDTPEAHAAFEEASKKFAAVMTAIRECQAAINSIPRVSVEQISDLVEIAKEGAAA